jgi:tetratricopeptide (TPR) repeat protein
LPKLSLFAALIFEFLKNNRKYYLLYVLVISVITWSCSTKRDSAVGRMYHNTTAHYNGYFNAEELIKKGQNTIRAAHKEDYDQILPIFIYGDKESAKGTFADMEKAIGKCEKVIARHTIKDDSKKTKKRPVFNKWIDENHMVIGKAYFYKQNYYKALDIFNYVNRKYKDPETDLRTSTWQARVYIAQGEYTKAVLSLARIEPKPDMDKDLMADYYLVLADAYLHQNKLDKAAENLKLGIDNIRKKRDRARPYFILAQIYQRLEKSDDAMTMYEMTIRSKPVYELEFQARINKALSFSRQGGSSAEIKKQLFKMLKDDKNVNYRDQIYYALGDIAFEEQQRSDAIAFYEESLKANVDNPKMKAKTFLRLADLYFDQRQYAEAQLFYDSTLTKVTETHLRYAEIKARAESLTDLIYNLGLIEKNDSLLKICALPEAERQKKAEALAEQLKRNAEIQKQKDIEAKEKAIKEANAGITGTFWAYNESLKSKGKKNFDDYWGGRPLKDNWRLQSKLAQSFGPGEEDVTAGQESVDPNTPTEDPYATDSAEELLSGLPCDDASKLEGMLKDAAEGYYNAGVIYKERLEDEDNAINSWEQLITNLDESAFHPTAYYQLFRTWLFKEQQKGYKKNPFCGTCNSKHWGDEIKSKYPGTDWAMLVDNPEYLDMQDVKKSEENAKYQQVYNLYASRNYVTAKLACDTVISTQPENSLLCKYKLLRAVCVGYTDAPYGIKENYQRELNAIAATCGGTDEGKRANELLKTMVEPPAKPSGSEQTPDGTTNVETPQEPGGTSNEGNPEGTPTEVSSPFKYDPDAEHYFAVVLPVAGTDINKSKSAVTDFNSNMFTSSQLKVTNNLLNKDNHLILIKSFKVLDDAKSYASTFEEDEAGLKDVNGKATHLFLISKQNYIALFKTKDLEGYMAFYQENYMK